MSGDFNGHSKAPERFINLPQHSPQRFIQKLEFNRKIDYPKIAKI